MSIEGLGDYGVHWDLFLFFIHCTFLSFVLTFDRGVDPPFFALLRWKLSLSALSAPPCTV